MGKPSGGIRGYGSIRAYPRRRPPLLYPTRSTAGHQVARICLRSARSIRGYARRHRRRQSGPGESVGRGSAVTPAASIRVDVRPPNYRLSMRYLMLMWAEADAASGDESDLQAWVDFDEQVKANGAFVLNGALAPASSDARLVQTAIAGHGLDGAVERRPSAEGKRQI